MYLKYVLKLFTRELNLFFLLHSAITILFGMYFIEGSNFNRGQKYFSGGQKYSSGGQILIGVKIFIGRGLKHFNERSKIL